MKWFLVLGINLVEGVADDAAVRTSALRNGGAGEKGSLHRGLGQGRLVASDKDEQRGASGRFFGPSRISILPPPSVSPFLSPSAPVDGD